MRRSLYPSRVTPHASRLLLVLLLAGCAVPQVPSRVIYEDPVNFVRLEPDRAVLPELPESAHAHPFATTPEEVARVLRGLMVQEQRMWLHRWISGVAPKEEVFREDEIALLAPWIATALSAARPSEFVTFYLSRPESSIKREITTGGLYVHQDELHIFLRNHRMVYGIPAHGMVYDRRYPTMSIAPKTFEMSFVPADAMIRLEPSVLGRMLGGDKDELVIDLKKVRAAKPVA